MSKFPFFTNGVEETALEALRFLSENNRPDGGQSRFNAEHLLQTADELEKLLDRLGRENAFLRVRANIEKCLYGHGDARWGCSLGYPGCACMDDLMAMTAWWPEDEEKAAVRLGKRAVTAEAQIEDMKRQHSARVSELLAANNRDVERRRAAEKRVREMEVMRDAFLRRFANGPQWISKSDDAVAELLRAEGLMEFMQSDGHCGESAASWLWRLTPKGVAVLKGEPYER